MVKRRRGSIQELLVGRERVWLPSGPYSSVFLLFGLMFVLPLALGVGAGLMQEGVWAVTFVLAVFTAIVLGRRAWYRREVPVAWSVDREAGTVTIEGRVLPAQGAVQILTWRPPLLPDADVAPDALPAAFPGTRCLGLIQRTGGQGSHHQGVIAWIYWSTEAEPVDALARALAHALGVGVEIR